MMPWEPQFGWVGVVVVWAIIMTIFTLLYDRFARRR
jgi:hypothetical protein